MRKVEELDLSRIVDQKEGEWYEEARDRLRTLINFLNDGLNQNLCELHKTDDDLELFAKLKFWLFGVHKELLYAGLEKFGLSVEKFEQEMIVSTILSVTMELDNLGFILEVMARGGVVDDLIVEGRNFTLKTSAGNFDFSKADEYFDYQNETVEEILRSKDLKGGCHEASEKLFESNSEYRIMTMICRKNLVENYYHSVVLIPDGKVADLTENLVMGKDDFCRLYDVQEKVVLSHGEYEELRAETRKYDKSKTLYPVLRVASYEWRKNGKL